jgi:mRNA interferase RelE/StbE
MEFLVIIPRKVQKELNKIPQNFRKKIITVLFFLSKNPYLGKKLEGERKGEWSLKVWPYRIIYTIKKEQLIVLIIKIGHRQGVYG